MAQPDGTFSSYDAIGNREDLTDVIWDVSPSETPVLSAMKKGTARATLHEWQTDALAAPAANAQVEGDDAVPVDADPTVRLNNQCQILTKHVVVSGTQEKVDKAGRNSEVAYQTAKRLAEIKTDLEWAMLNGGGVAGIGNAKVAGDNVTAREMGSIQTYLSTNYISAGTDGTASAGDGSDVMTAGTGTAFTEAMLTALLQDIYTVGGMPKVLVVSPTNKGVVSTFVGGGTHFVDKDNKKLVNSVDVYIGDFHTLTVMPSRQCSPENVLAIDPSHVSYAELRPVSASPLAVTGDSTRKQIVMEGTLAVLNQNAHGIIADTLG